MQNITIEIDEDVNVIDIDILVARPKTMQGISDGLASWMHECARFCLQEQGHSTECKTKVFFSDVESDYNDYNYIWADSIPQEDFPSFNDDNEVTNYAAMGIAVVQTLLFTEHSTFDRAGADGTGIDFTIGSLLSPKGVERLEVSGIRKESRTNSFSKRIITKSEQSKKSDNMNSIAYISVTEFSSPKSAFFTRRPE